MSKFILFIFHFFILTIKIETYPVIKPNELISNIKLDNQKYILIEIPTSELKPNQFYKIMVHYLAAVNNF